MKQSIQKETDTFGLLAMKMPPKTTSWAGWSFPAVISQMIDCGDAENVVELLTTMLSVP